MTERKVETGASRSTGQASADETNNPENTMNKAKLIELLKNGAVFDTKEEKFYHPSFRKGWRKLTWGNISWQAVRHELGLCGSNQLQGIVEGRITLKS